MYCKNCDTPLRFKASFCHGCGAKIIRNRLTIKNLWTDFSQRFLNVENYLFRTFKDMFKQPEAVISSYISGVRKRYINPAGYFTFAVTLIGFLYFIQRKFFNSTFTEAFSAFDPNNSGTNNRVSESISTTLQTVLEYQSLILILTIPFLALVSKIVFYNYKNFNFSEHIVLHIYTYSHYTIILTFSQLLTIWNSTLFFGIAFFTAFFQLAYYIYVLKRLFQLDLGQIIAKTLIFFAVSFVLYIICAILIVLCMFVFSNFFEEIIKEIKKGTKVVHIPITLYQWASLKWH